jgi:hypothetical protein
MKYARTPTEGIKLGSKEFNNRMFEAITLASGARLAHNVSMHTNQNTGEEDVEDVAYMD